VETTTLERPTTSVGLLSSLRSSVSELDDVLWAARPPEELVAAKLEMERLRSQLAAVDAALVCEIEATKAAQREQWASTGDYVTSVSGGRQGSGQRTLRVGRALVGERTATLGALRRGDVSLEQAEVIVAAVDRLPVKLSLRQVAETRLLEDARSLNATELEKAGRLLLELVDPDGSERREEKALARSERLRISVGTWC
jgi:hypothetical protein